ncbi:MAG TPA: DUF1345 domain-containing protein [Sphingomicrobium sp.]|nr:DUF1345 domain-containing protein [Sphingomicrobium sp.]
MTTKQKTQAARALGNRIAPLRFLFFLALLIGVYFAYRAAWPATKWTDGAAMAFDAATVLFLASLVPLLKDSSPEEIRAHAAQNDANRLLILIVTSSLTIVAMVAISGELDGARSGQLVSIVKLVGTLFLIWLFANSIYALHYAHAYYTFSDETGTDTGGLDFPGTKCPGYDDFLYFSCTLGMTFQTSDTNITASGIRRVALLHSFAAFVFSIGVIAFTINVLGGSGG